jgi:hypothetical protein
VRKQISDIVIRRLAAAFDRKDSWPDDARLEFARGTADLDDNVAMETLDWIIKHEEFRPTIAKFRAEAIRITRNRTEGFHATRSPSATDKAAAAFFAPRLKDILQGIGSGPQGGTAALCDQLVEEWRARTQF